MDIHCRQLGNQGGKSKYDEQFEKGLWVPNLKQVSIYSNICAQVLRGVDENYAQQYNIMKIPIPHIALTKRCGQYPQKGFHT
jgi:hypothetical protein